MAEGNQALLDEDTEPSLEDHISELLLCPISRCIMEEPVVTPSGNTYDRATIVDWLKRRAVDPLSGAPLSPYALYPNRVVQDEILAQLDQLAVSAETGGNRALSAAARSKAQSMRAVASASNPDSEMCQLGYLGEVGVIERWAHQSMRVTAWCSEFVREQALVLLTSFGAIMCLGTDIRRTLGRGETPPKSSGGLLSMFLKLATLPSTPAPDHWRWISWTALMALRSVILVPIIPVGFAFTFGCCCSLFNFVRHSMVVRAVELERAAQSDLWIRVRDLGSAITGIASFGIALRIVIDSSHVRRSAERA